MADKSLRILMIIGAGGHAASCGDVALAAGVHALCFVDLQSRATELLGFPVVPKIDECLGANEDGEAPEVLVALGDNFRRQQVVDDIRSKWPRCRFPAVVHPRATVSPFASLGEGTVIMAGAVIGPRSRIGRFCIVNSRAAIDHDGLMEDFASLAPGAVAGGGVTIGHRSAVSLGAALKHGVCIGSDTVIGAMSYVDKNLGDNAVCYGLPARVVRKRAVGEPYLA